MEKVPYVKVMLIAVLVGTLFSDICNRNRVTFI